MHSLHYIEPKFEKRFKNLKSRNVCLEKAKISAKHKRIASWKRLKVNLKPVPLADSEGWLQDKRCRETKASCCLKGKNHNLWTFFMCQLQIHFCPIYWFYVLLSCHCIILAISWSRWTAMTEERSVTDPVSARWGRRKLEKVIHIRWSTCTVALLVKYCIVVQVTLRRGCWSRRRRGRLSWRRLMITSMTWRKIWLHQPSSHCCHRNLAEPQCGGLHGHYGQAWKVWGRGAGDWCMWISVLKIFSWGLRRGRNTFTWTFETESKMPKKWVIALTVVFWMSPLGIAHWTFETESKMTKKWVIA